MSPKDPQEHLDGLLEEVRSLGAGDDDEDLQELKALCRSTTADTVLRDLERGRRILRSLPPGRRTRAQRYVERLERLERWLHDF